LLLDQQDRSPRQSVDRPALEPGLVSPSAERNGYEGAQSRWLVSLQPLHTPIPGIPADQRTEVSGQHLARTPTSPRIPHGSRHRPPSFRVCAGHRPV